MNWSKLVRRMGKRKRKRRQGSESDEDKDDAVEEHVRVTDQTVICVSCSTTDPAAFSKRMLEKRGRHGDRVRRCRECVLAAEAVEREHAAKKRATEAELAKQREVVAPAAQPEHEEVPTVEEVAEHGEPSFEDAGNGKGKSSGGTGAKGQEGAKGAGKEKGVRQQRAATGNWACPPPFPPQISWPKLWA